MTQPLWTALEIANATQGRWLIAPPTGWQPQLVSYDINSRIAGHICVLPHPASWGRNRKDPSDQIPRLAKEGAAAVIVQPEHLTHLKQSLGQLPVGLPICLVPNTALALRDLARIARMRFRGKVIAVTGSVGKTTTREMLRHMAEGQGGAEASKANNNNIAGVQRTLAYLPRDAAAGVLEMGFGRPLDGIARSSQIAQPDVTLLTMLDHAHFDMFTPAMLKRQPGLDLLLDHKSGIHAGLVPGGGAVLCGDIPNIARAKAIALRQTPDVFTYGRGAEHDAFLLSLECDYLSSRADISILGMRHRLTLSVPGRHMVENALGALLALTLAGFDPAQAIADLETFAPVNGRAKVVEADLLDGRKITLIDDSFNATLLSVRSTLDLLSLAQPRGRGRRVALLGEIGHIGAEEVAAHRGLAETVAASEADLVFSWGPLMREMFEALPDELRGAHEDMSVEALYRAVFDGLRDGDVLTIKSGRGANGLGDARFRKFVKGLKGGATALVL